MKWLEIIELRTGYNRGKDLQALLGQLINEVKQDPEQPKIKIYMHSSMGNDYSIQLSHKHSKPDETGSELGARIVDLLKGYGLINYNIWIEKSEVTLDPIH